jgi:hypothetical protein
MNTHVFGEKRESYRRGETAILEEAISLETVLWYKFSGDVLVLETEVTRCYILTQRSQSL